MERRQLRALVEDIVDGALDSAASPGPVFAPVDPVKVVKYQHDYVISREFGLKLTSELILAMSLTELDVAEANENGGVLQGEWELSLDVDVYYDKGSPGRMYGHPDRWSPPDPESFEIEGFEVQGILLYSAKSMVVFSPSDNKQLKDLVGELTEGEVDSVREQYIENLPEPDFDPPEPDYDY